MIFHYQMKCGLGVNFFFFFFTFCIKNNIFCDAINWSKNQYCMDFKMLPNTPKSVYIMEMDQITTEAPGLVSITSKLLQRRSPLAPTKNISLRTGLNKCVNNLHYNIIVSFYIDCPLAVDIIWIIVWVSW